MADGDTSNLPPSDDSASPPDSADRTVDEVLGKVSSSIDNLTREISDPLDDGSKDTSTQKPSAADPPELENQLDELEALLDQANQQLSIDASELKSSTRPKTSASRVASSRPVSSAVVMEESDSTEAESIPSLEELVPVASLTEELAASLSQTKRSENEPTPPAGAVTKSTNLARGASHRLAFATHRFEQLLDWMVRLLEWCDRPMAHVGDTARLWAGCIASGTLLTSLILWAMVLFA